MTAAKICKLLERRFSFPKYLTMFEVRNTTGFAHTERYADAISLGIWPSSGLYLDGFEIKVSSSDLKHELEHPEKHEVIKQYCDHWWLVLSDIWIIGSIPIPLDWGVIECSQNRLNVIKKARKLEPKAIPRGFLASMLRNAYRSKR